MNTKNNCIHCSKVEGSVHMFKDFPNVSIAVLTCSSCQMILVVKYGCDWETVDNALKSEIATDAADEKCVIKAVCSDDDKRRLFLLAQIVYNQLEIDMQFDESPFTLFTYNEDACLCVVRGEAVGFCTVKNKGSPIQHRSVCDVFAMTMVDTLFVRKSHRKRGIATSILDYIFDRYPHEDVGFSEPLSVSMSKLLKRYLTKNAPLRDRLWLCRCSGAEGDRANLWLLLNSTSSRFSSYNH